MHSYNLDPWGHVRRQAGYSINRHIFTDKEHDLNTGLVYFGARYYDPDTARFITQDSYLGVPGTPPSLHRYLYAYNNPTAYVDPNGHIGIFFDGTGMDKNQKDIPETNVGKLFDVYTDGSKIYENGVGSNLLTKYSFGGFSGAGGSSRVEEAYDELVDAYNAARNDEERVIDIFGFSRGAALARDFANVIREKGIPDRTQQIGAKRVRDIAAEEAANDGETRYKEIPVYKSFENVNVRFLGLFDTVGSFGMPGNNVDYGHEFSVDNQFIKETRHAIAADEYRGLFGLQSILEGKDAKSPVNMIEKVFRGAHSDVGGGYGENEDNKSNALSRNPLNWMYNEAAAAGVKMKPLNRVDQTLLDIDSLTEAEIQKKYIHDSRYSYEKWHNKKTRDIYYSNDPKKQSQLKITTENIDGQFEGTLRGLGE